MKDSGTIPRTHTRGRRSFGQGCFSHCIRGRNGRRRRLLHRKDTRRSFHNVIDPRTRARRRSLKAAVLVIASWTAADAAAALAEPTVRCAE